MTTYAYLGPAATFTEAALQTLATSQDSITPYANVTAALNAVRTGAADRALVPIENSVEGVVARTLDELAIGGPLVIYGEVTLPVTFALMVEKGKRRARYLQSQLTLTLKHNAAPSLQRIILMLKSSKRHQPQQRR